MFYDRSECAVTLSKNSFSSIIYHLEILKFDNEHEHQMSSYDLFLFMCFDLNGQRLESSGVTCLFFNDLNAVRNDRAEKCFA